MVDDDLSVIQDKVRILTRSYSTAQLSTNTLNDHINRFILYIFPEELRTFTLTDTFSFQTEPNIEIYDKDNTDYDPNTILNVLDPIYIAGRRGWLVQSQEEFYSWYLQTQTTEKLATGDASTVSFSGTLDNVPLLRNNVLVESITANNDGLSLTDDGAGTLSGDGSGTIDYESGAVSVTFDTAPANAEAINVQGVRYVANRPEAVLYFSNKFFVRPVPDRPYTIKLTVQKAPTELLSSNQSPELKQWSQLIWYGVSIQIYYERLDMESAALLMPEYQNQLKLGLRRTIKQLSTQRAATIYSTPWPWGNSAFGRNY